MKGVQAILREIVNDLEKTAAIQAYLMVDVSSLKPRSRNEIDAMVELAAANNKEFYTKLRVTIDALQIS